MSTARRIGRLLSLVLTGSVALMVAPSPASASPFYPYETNQAALTSASPPSDAICDRVQISSSYYIEGCFQKYGDRWWVRQIGNDITTRAYIEWENELAAYQGPLGTPNYEVYRDGQCLAAPSTSQWSTCEKDYYENSSTNYFGLKGSRLYWHVCLAPYDSCYTSRTTVNNG
ncbi:hypothetical protein ACQPWW_17400 [Micromonospora sp. CA-240977]|uniref:hypothetical protein n=1 Tax=Micromonospora sp. CA-240977 TaxID=3239957 RepID=UPI003D8A2F9A